MRLFIVLCALFSLNLSAEEQFPAWELPNTQVHQLPAQSNGRHYEVWVELPPSYGKTEKKFPVLFVSDANYAFPLIRSIRNRLGAGGQNIEDFVIVGLSYAKEDNPTDSRSLDYTPTNVLKRAKKPGLAAGSTTAGVTGAGASLTSGATVGATGTAVVSTTASTVTAVAGSDCGAAWPAASGAGATGKGSALGVAGA